MDRIEIHGLEVKCKIGVPDGERAHSQTLRVDLTLYPERPFAAMDDRLEGGADYAEVARIAVETAGGRARNLIETLAADLARIILEKFPLKRVEVTVRKFILPETDWVAAKTFAEK